MFELQFHTDDAGLLAALGVLENAAKKRFGISRLPLPTPAKLEPPQRFCVLGEAWGRLRLGRRARMLARYGHKTSLVWWCPCTHTCYFT